jgi:RNA polymerase sigma-70 factor (ECF subfamily)
MLQSGSAVKLDGAGATSADDYPKDAAPRYLSGINPYFDPKDSQPEADETGELSRAERFESLYRQWYDDVFYYCLRRMVGTDVVARAEDTAHEAFTVVWRRLDAIPERPDDVAPWLYTVARNCLMHSQRSAVRRSALAVKVQDDFGVSGRGQAPATADLSNLALDFQQAWQALSSTDQEAISLTAFEGLTAAQAANHLGISVAAFKFRLHSARKRLRKLTD